MTAKRNWPTHPGIGREIEVDGVLVKIVDVKAGPMLGNVHDALQGSPLVLSSTLKLRVKYASGYEAWIPPIDGEEFCAWCSAQDARAAVAEAAQA